MLNETLISSSTAMHDKDYRDGPDDLLGSTSANSTFNSDSSPSTTVSHEGPEFSGPKRIAPFRSYYFPPNSKCRTRFMPPTFPSPQPLFYPPNSRNPLFPATSQHFLPNPDFYRFPSPQGPFVENFQDCYHFNGSDKMFGPPRELLYVNTGHSRTHNHYNREKRNFDGGHKQKQHTQQNNAANFSEDDTMLFLRRVPLELNKINCLSEFFSKFGTIRNIEIGYLDDCEASLIQFATSEQAHSAFRSPDAVFNNRFIKVYWGSIGRSVMEKKCNMKNVKRSKRDASSTPTTSKETNAVTTTTPAAPMMNISVTERELLIQQSREEYVQLKEALAKQASLLSKMDAAKTASEKSSVLDLLKLAMYNVKEIEKSLQKKQALIKQAQRTVKVNVDRKRTQRPSSATSTNSGSFNGSKDRFNIEVSSEEEEDDDNHDEDNFEPSKRYRSDNSTNSTL